MTKPYRGTVWDFVFTHFDILLTLIEENLLTVGSPIVSQLHFPFVCLILFRQRADPVINVHSQHLLPFKEGHRVPFAWESHAHTQDLC